MFFFQKKNQKTFVLCRYRSTDACRKDKSFLPLFFKKEGLASSLLGTGK